MTEANKWWWSIPISSLPNLKTAAILPEGTTCQGAVALLKTTGDARRFFITLDNRVQGVITADTLLSKIISGASTRTDYAESIMTKQFAKVTTSTTLGRLSRILEKELFAAVVDDNDALIGIVDQSDLFDFISKNDNVAQNGRTGHAAFTNNTDD